MERRPLNVNRNQQITKHNQCNKPGAQPRVTDTL